jgi:hypothetical protein
VSLEDPLAELEAIYERQWRQDRLAPWWRRALRRTGAAARNARTYVRVGRPSKEFRRAVRADERARRARLRDERRLLP